MRYEYRLNSSRNYRCRWYDKSILSKPPSITTSVALLRLIGS